MKALSTIIIFIAYLAILLRLVVFRNPLESALVGENLMPFETILMYLNGKPSLMIAIFNLVGNIALFIPLGIFASLLFRKAAWWHILIGGALFSFVLETLQLILQVGSFDVDDILLNTLGVMLGYALSAAIKKKYSHV